MIDLPSGTCIIEQQTSTGCESSQERAACYLPIGLVGRIWTRGLDLIIGTIGMILAAPLFVLVALLIKTESEGPVFYSQLRIGLHRKRFWMLKFRKMRSDLPTQGPSITRRHDTRLTVVGAFLERTKLDELPQLINVLAGDMSVVGPRPEVPKFVAATTGAMGSLSFP